MEIIELLHSKLWMARRVLEDLIKHYEGMEDAQRVEKSNTIMDALDSYLQIEENLLFPFMLKTGEYGDLVARSRAVHQDIDQLTEHMIMMHVDEPGGEYYNGMVRLQPLLERTAQVDEEAIFPWCREYLSEEDQYYIATHVKNQMVHESLPSSGMTIY